MIRQAFNRIALLLLLFTCLAVSALANQPAPNKQPEQEIPDAVEQGQIDLRMGGVGGVYFLASPGELIVDIEKRDLSRSKRCELRAILVGPDRRVIQEATIPEGKSLSGRAPAQRVRLKVRVERKGVYVLNVTVSKDQYGKRIAWGFRTNCPHYLIETECVHRAQTHKTPIVLRNREQPGDVCFMPRTGKFGIEVSGLLKGADPLSVFDANGQLIQSLPVDVEGQVSHVFPADVDRNAVPWRLHLPVAWANVQIDGVTQRQKGDRSCWTPKIKSYFPLIDYRWLITPYKKTIYGRPGDQGEMAFEVHNNSTRKQTIELSLEFPTGQWPASLSDSRVEVDGKRSVQVTVRYAIPAAGKTRVCHIRATPVDAPEFSTYSTLTVKAGESPATRPLDMPLVLKPYRHENEQFGYLPTYPLDNQVYFDLKNRPFVASSTGLKVKGDKGWDMADLRKSVRWPTSPTTGRGIEIISSKVAFDRDNGVYVLGRSGRTNVLLHSTDSGKTFSACPIPGRGEMDIEQFSGHNRPDGPPPVLQFICTAIDQKHRHWRIHNLTLFLPKLSDGRLLLGKPILISRKCIGLSAHSGTPSSIISRGSKVHVVWAETTDPTEEVPGVPTYVVTYDRTTGKLGKPQLVGHGPPANDIHNSPSITMDSKGFLHVLVGTHCHPFPYTRSLKPNDANGGWTKPEFTVSGLPEMTYIGLVCDSDDTLHLVYRLWKRGAEPFPAGTYAALVYQRKPRGKPWEAPKTLIVPPFSEYSVFYHRLTIDRIGRLFLSYDYWSTYWFYRSDHRGSRHSLMMSPDAGRTWKLVESDDFRESTDLSLLRWLSFNHTGFYARVLAVGELVCEEPLLIEAFDLFQTTGDR